MTPPERLGSVVFESRLVTNGRRAAMVQTIAAAALSFGSAAR
jgi:hypothetical protein